MPEKKKRASEIYLRAMSAKEFGPWKQQSFEEYARDKETQGLSTEDARAEAEKSFAALLPNGLGSPDQYLYVVAEISTEEAVGSLWWGVRKEHSQPMGWVYNIRITEEFRGRGYGREAMIAAETDVKSRGLARFGLHVFGYNTPARKLYQSLGFAETNVVMQKDLT